VDPTAPGLDNVLPPEEVDALPVDPAILPVPTDDAPPNPSEANPPAPRVRIAPGLDPAEAPADAPVDMPDVNPVAPADEAAFAELPREEGLIRITGREPPDKPVEETVEPDPAVEVKADAVGVDVDPAPAEDPVEIPDNPDNPVPPTKFCISPAEAPDVAEALPPDDPVTKKIGLKPPCNALAVAPDPVPSVKT